VVGDDCRYAAGAVVSPLLAQIARPGLERALVVFEKDLNAAWMGGCLVSHDNRHEIIVAVVVEIPWRDRSHSARRWWEVMLTVGNLATLPT
jgi:hypothetical protein